jgi:hypothetical protein
MAWSLARGGVGAFQASAEKFLNLLCHPLRARDGRNVTRTLGNQQLCMWDQLRQFLG